MALSQVQIIRSLGEALAWFEKELAWGVQPAQLGHLTGRIGELYAAMITRGQMAIATNQHGYDVVSADNERISVKTVTSSQHISFRKSTLDLVDRVLVLRLNVDEGEASIEELLDCNTDQLRACSVETGTDHRFNVRPRKRAAVPISDLTIATEAMFEEYRIVRYETGTIAVEQSGVTITPAKPALRQISMKLGISLTNSDDVERTTRQLGADILTLLRRGTA